MAAQPKILLLDDDQDFLDLYQEMLSQHLPSLPEVHAANSGAKALSMLETDTYHLLSVDLHMPKMDGLQVLAIARRKFPNLRLVVLTALRDEQFRSRAYAMGVDQYWIKPETDMEMGLLMESFESLLHSDTEGGFRGVQSKSLVDIIQLECLSQSSAVLRISNGKHEGKIWLNKGEVIDAELADIKSEPAFQRILSWKAGAFEILPADSTRSRAIFTSYQGLLLNTAQALDEAASRMASAPDEEGTATLSGVETSKLISDLARIPGVEFILAQGNNGERKQESWGLDSPQPIAEWSHEILAQFSSLADELQVGQVRDVVASGPQRKLAMSSLGDAELCVGLIPDMPADRGREVLRTVVEKWDS